MSCSMDLLNWVDECYKQQELSTSRNLPFDLISRILNERKETLRIEREEAQAIHKTHMSKIVTLFKEALKHDGEADFEYCYDDGCLIEFTDDYFIDNLPELPKSNELAFNQKFDGANKEDWIDRAFNECFAMCFISTLNTNLTSHPRDCGDDDDWYDGRYPEDSIWKNYNFNHHNFWC